MGRDVICDTCGKPILLFGWRAYPARVEGGQLVGTIGEGEEARPVGLGVDLHTGCAPKDHPLEGEETKRVEEPEEADAVLE